MFQPSTTNSPKFDPEIAEQPESTGYNWQKWAKWGLLSAGGIVLTTAVMYYGGPTLVAGLSSLAAGIASRFKESGQETALSIGQHTRLRYIPSSLLPQLQLDMDEFHAAEKQKQELMQSIAAYSKTKEGQRFLAELGEYEEDDDEDEKEKRETLTTSESSSSSTNAPEEIYFNDFAGSIGPEWSVSLTDQTPAGSNPFLGRFANNDAVNLTLTGLPIHNRVKIGFDLYIIQSWDGNDDIDGPDIWTLDIVGGKTLFNTTFANWDNSDPQAYPNNYPEGSNPRGTGAVAINTLGYSSASDMDDSVYHLDFTFVHIEDSIIFRFSGSGLEGVSDESWGIDNLSVVTKIATPTNGLLAYYPFNGNANDESWNGYHGIPCGATLTDDRFGNPNSAYELEGNTGNNGANKYIAIPNMIEGELNLTIALWVNEKSISHEDGDAYIGFGVMSSTTEEFFGIVHCPVSDEIRINITNENERQTFVIPFSSQGQLTNNFRFYALVYDGEHGTVKGYLDGNLVGNFTMLPGAVYTNSVRGALGKHWWNVGGSESATRFNGIFDDVRIYNRTLSEEEIQALYYLSVDPNKGLVAYYPFNGNANDTSGNAYHGTAHNNVTLIADRFGNPDSAYYFDGVDDRIKLRAEILDGVTDFSVGFWVKTVDTRNPVFISAANSGQSNEFILDHDSGMVGINIRNIGTHIFTDTNVHDSIWHNVFLVRSLTTGRLYIDGNLVDTYDGFPSSALSIDPNGLWLGGEQDCVGGCWDPVQQYEGIMDDVIFYNRTLSNEEIQLLYLNPYWAINIYQSLNYIEDTPQVFQTIKLITPEINSFISLSFSDQNAGQLITTSPIFNVISTFVDGVWHASGNTSEINNLLLGLTFEPFLDYDKNFTMGIYIEDGRNTPINSNITVTGIPVNDRPILVQNRLIITPEDENAGIVILTSDMLRATDVDNEDPDLEFILSELANGQVEVELTPGNWTVATNFTQQLVADGNVRFVLNKESRYAPSYYVSVYDGELYTDPEAVSVIFNNPSLISGTSEQLVTSSITYDKQNVAAILGAVIGGGVLLCVAIGGGILCYRRSHANTSDEVALSDISPRAESHKRMISMMVQDGQINMELAIPFSELTLGEKIGGGGSGIVHEGTWHGTKVAVKHLLFVDFDERAMREFLREVTMMANLRHPNIVEFYKVCIEPEKNCIVMEYMAGGSLYDLLHSEGELEWVLRLQFALEICQGLKYLHHNNIVHRDLKSLNVLLDERQQHAKLTDFGLSKQDTGTATMTKAIGTPAWMPPEALNDERYTPKSDIYSYGIILHELATREDPYPGIKNVTIMQEVLKGRRPVLPAKCPCPSRFSLLMQRCWAGRPDERPDAITVAQKLKEQQELGDTTWHAASIQTI